MSIIHQVKKNKIIYILAFTVLISSIGIEPNILLNLNQNNKITDIIITGIRSSSPIFITLFTVIYILKNYKKINYEFTYIIIFSYVLSIILSFYLNMSSYATVSNFENIWINNFLALQSLSFFLLLYALYLDDLKFDFILYYVFIFTFLTYSYFIVIAFKELFSGPNILLYTSDYLTNGELFRSAVPRSSGISRIIAMVAIINMIFLLNRNLNKPKIFFYSITFSFLYFFLIILQSRTSFYTLNILISLIFLISIRKRFWKNLKIFFLVSGIIFLIIKLFPTINNFFSAYTVIKGQISSCNLNISVLKISKKKQSEIIGNYMNAKKFSVEECEALSKDFMNKKNKKMMLPTFDLEKFDIKNYRGKIDNALEYNVNNLKNDEKTLIQNLLKLENKFNVIELKNIKDDNELLEKRIQQRKIILDYIHKDHKEYLLLKRDQQNLLYEYFKLNNREISLIRLNNCPYLNTRINELLTGRICHNYVALNDVGLQILGKGARYDRTVLKWGISNTLVYSYVSAGVIGVIFYLYICYMLLLFFLKFIKDIFNSTNSNFTNKEILTQCLMFLMLFIMSRSIFEISFGYWGIDQLIFIISFVYYKKFIFNKPKLV